MVRGNLSQNTDQNGFDFRRQPNDSKYHSRERLKYWVRKYFFGGKVLKLTFIMRIGIFLDDCFDHLVPGSIQNCRFFLELDHFRFQKATNKYNLKVTISEIGSFFNPNNWQFTNRETVYIQSEFSKNKTCSRTVAD